MNVAKRFIFIINFEHDWNESVHLPIVVQSRRLCHKLWLSEATDSTKYTMMYTTKSSCFKQTRGEINTALPYNKSV